MASSREQPG